MDWLWTFLTMLGTGATAVIIYWQANLLRAQNQVDALVQLNLAWDSRETCRLRTAWASDPEDFGAVEAVLEFLEEFAALAGRNVFDEDLIWDSTLGWYAARYYFYNHENGMIDRLRADWLDDKLYENLGKLWEHYENREDKGVSEGKSCFIEKLRRTREKFLNDEKARYARRFPESSD
jgi:hypothetical protein